MICTKNIADRPGLKLSRALQRDEGERVWRNGTRQALFDLVLNTLSRKGQQTLDPAELFLNPVVSDLIEDSLPPCEEIVPGRIEEALTI